MAIQQQLIVKVNLNDTNDKAIVRTKFVIKYMKLKTHKATAKRFKLKKSGKIIKRSVGQDHFNSKESGVITRNKRSDKQITNKKNIKTIKRLLVK